MNLSGQEIQQLRDAVVAAFTQQELIELMRYDLDVKLANVVSLDDPLRTVAFNTISWLIQRGNDSVRRFVEAIYNARKKHQDIIQFCQTKAPYLLTANDSAQATLDAVQGFTAVSTATGTDPSVKTHLGAAMRPLEETATGISILTELKKAHDQLHFLELRLVRELRNKARDFKNNPAGAEEKFQLEVYVRDLNRALRKIHLHISNLPAWLLPAAPTFLDFMDQAHNEIIFCLQNASGDPLHQVNGLLIKGMIGLSPILHAEIFKEASRLPLQTIIDLFSGLIPLLPAAAPVINGALSGMQQLLALLRNQVQEHGFWQGINIKLHLVEDGIAKMQAIGTSNRETQESKDVAMVLGPSLAQVTGFCAIRKNESWTSVIDEAVKGVDIAWNRRESAPDDIGRAFLMFQKEVGEHFKDLDEQLLALCEKLSGLDGPINILKNQL